jgi:hypothetical protein
MDSDHVHIMLLHMACIPSGCTLVSSNIVKLGQDYIFSEQANFFSPGTLPAIPQASWTTGMSRSFNLSTFRRFAISRRPMIRDLPRTEGYGGDLGVAYVPDRIMQVL